MIQTKSDTRVLEITPVMKLKLYLELLKFRLSLLVAFSAGVGYLLAIKGNINWINFAVFSFGGFLVSGASIVINQILEKDIDRLMKRTCNRPLPSFKILPQEAVLFGFLVGLAGFTLLLVSSNWYTVLLSLLSMVLYGFVYTPMKRVGPLAVWVGAIPGALPPMIGWIAATGTFSLEAFILFLLQFFWQFPHFWAIAWVMDEDYQKAGFKLLPSKGGKDTLSALQIMFTTLLLIPAGWLPTYFGITGSTSAIIATISAMAFLIPTFILVKEKSRRMALMIMFGSFLYLPIVQFAYLMDKL